MDKICARCSSPVRGSRCPVCGYDCSVNSEAVSLKAGTCLDDRYVIGRVLGKGGFGITYIAYDTEMEKTVAIKEYYPIGTAVRAADNRNMEPLTSMQQEEFALGLEKFKNEAEILSKMDSGTSVIKVFGTFLENGTAYYVMEYVHGITIGEYVSKYGRISEEQAVYMTGEIVTAFRYIHGSGIIHRDISPGNIMINLDSQIRLVDFGNARPFSANGDNSMTVALKPGYAPLEQYQHHGKHGPWTDIYSLGAVLYYALTLTVPNDPMTRLDDDRSFQNGLLSMNAGLAAIVRRMSAVRVQDRYSCGEEIMEDLQALEIVPQKFETGDIE